jgi:hypothetical protein
VPGSVASILAGGRAASAGLRDALSHRVRSCRAIHFTGDPPMLLTLAIILFVVWALCVLAFKITFAVVHLLVILAVIAVVLHFYRKARASV